MAIHSIFVVCDDIEALPELCLGAKSLGETVTAIIFGDDATAKATPCGADSIRYCPVSDECLPEDWAVAIADEIKKVSSAVVLVNNSIRGRCLAGKLGVHLDTAVLTNAADFVVEEDRLICSRMVYGGTAHSKYVFTKPYGVLTVGGGAFEINITPSVCTDIAPLNGSPSASSIKRIALQEKKSTSVNLAVAKRIVDVGRGLAKEDDLDMCRQLASVLGAEVGCSRPVAENNKWLPKNCYMGITGVQVKPDVIIVLGVSGQVQHIGGINKSRIIVAINKDKAAPIFKNADFGVVGDMYKIVPALIEKLS